MASPAENESSVGGQNPCKTCRKQDPEGGRQFWNRLCAGFGRHPPVQKKGTHRQKQGEHREP